MNSRLYTTSQARTEYDIEPGLNPKLIEVDLNKQDKNAVPQELQDQLVSFKETYKDSSVRCWMLK